LINIVLSDLDSTLADVQHRAHLARLDSQHPNDWIKYSLACINDTPMAGPVRTLQMLAETFPIYLVSGRNIEAQDATEEWLNLVGVPYEELRLHRSTDDMHNGRYKVGYIQELRSRGYNPMLMLEDHLAVAAMVEAVGVPVLSVNPRYDDTIGVAFNNLEPQPFATVITGAPSEGSNVRHRRAPRTWRNRRVSEN
jgi:hypothetical protein